MNSQTKKMRWDKEMNEFLDKGNDKRYKEINEFLDKENEMGQRNKNKLLDI